MSQLQNMISEHGRPRDPTSKDYIQITKQLHDLIRYKVLVENNVEVLAEFVLGYKPKPFHREFMRWQNGCKEGMLLAWRGSAKTTYCTITRCIFEILKNPNIRILLAAASSAQGENFIRGIKSHLESNPKLREIFGDYTTNAPLWTTSAFTVNRRSSHAPEPTLMAVGAGTALPSRHYDLIICDDLVISDNAATEGQRKKIVDYYYSTLLPTLDPKEGRIWVLGTRWHDQDIYGWLQKEDYKDSTFIMSVLDEEDHSRWEEQFPIEKMLRIRRANINAFEMQYMCRSGIGSAGVFTEPMFDIVDQVPTEGMNYWMGIDFAVGQKEHNDFFSISVIATNKITKEVYLIEAIKKKIPFPEQIDTIRSVLQRYPQIIRVVAEANGQQMGLLQQIKKDIPEIPLLPKFNQLDKTVKAQHITLLLSSRPLKVMRDQHEFVRLLLGFPNIHGSKDVFDSFEIAYSVSIKGARKERSTESTLDTLI